MIDQYHDVWCPLTRADDYYVNNHESNTVSVSGTGVLDANVCPCRYSAHNDTTASARTVVLGDLLQGASCDIIAPPALLECIRG